MILNRWYPCDAYVSRDRSLAGVGQPCRYRATHDLGAIRLCRKHHEEIFEAEVGDQVRAAMKAFIRKHREPPAKQAPARPAVVYIAESAVGAHAGLVKIGTTTNLAARMKALECHPLAVIPGGVEKERELHRRYRRSRVAGEWFRLSPAIARLIASQKEEAA